jgi:hypothetical protein
MNLNNVLPYVRGVVLMGLLIATQGTPTVTGAPPPTGSGQDPISISVSPDRVYVRGAWVGIWATALSTGKNSIVSAEVFPGGSFVENARFDAQVYNSTDYVLTVHFADGRVVKKTAHVVLDEKHDVSLSLSPNAVNPPGTWVTIKAVARGAGIDRASLDGVDFKDSTSKSVTVSQDTTFKLDVHYVDGEHDTQTMTARVDPDISINVSPNPVHSPGTTVVTVYAVARGKDIVNSTLDGVPFKLMTSKTDRTCYNKTYTLDVYFVGGSHQTKTATVVVDGQCIQ